VALFDFRPVLTNCPRILHALWKTIVTQHKSPRALACNRVACSGNTSRLAWDCRPFHLPNKWSQIVEVNGVLERKQSLYSFRQLALDCVPLRIAVGPNCGTGFIVQRGKVGAQNLGHRGVPDRSPSWHARRRLICSRPCSQVRQLGAERVINMQRYYCCIRLSF
jgi:hypothetical protein